MTEPLIRSRQPVSLTPNRPLTEDMERTDLPVPHGHIRAESDLEAPPGIPRWVKVFGIVALVAVLLFAGLRFAGGHTAGMANHVPGSGGAQHSMQLP